MGEALQVRFWDEVTSLVWPVQCSGCGVWDHVLCDSCAALAKGDTYDGILDDVAGVPTWPLVALGTYEDALRRVILSAKHDPVRDLDGFLSQAGKTLGAALPTQVWWEAGKLIWVVPAPSSLARERARTQIVPTVAQALASSLRSQTGTPVTVVPALRFKRKWFRVTQAGLAKAARERGRVGSMTLVHKPPPFVRVVIVDDVVASGSTLREMLRLLGPNAIAVAVLAVAPP